MQMYKGVMQKKKKKVKERTEAKVNDNIIHI